jgi:arsenate reductase (thioredoxin)
MAEGLLRGIARDRFELFSAGTEAPRLRPEAISAQESETLDRYLREPLDLVITVCDAANEAWPVFPGAGERLHWSFPDPSTAAGGYEEHLRAVRDMRDVRSEPVSGANWRRQGCDPDRAPSGTTASKHGLLSSASCRSH